MPENEEKKRVSIVVPVFNAEDFIDECIESCLIQGDFAEIIVVDDGSTDSTPKKLDSFGSRIRVLHTQNMGAPLARNLGVESAHTDLIKFLDADDVLIEGSLERQLDNSPADFVASREIPCGYAIEINQSGERIGLRKSRPCSEFENPFAHILRNSPITTCPLHSRQALLEIGGFDKELRRGQEQDLHIRLVAAGYKFVFQDIPIYLYRQHGDGSNISGGLLTRYGKDVPLRYVERFETLAIETFGEPIDPEIRLALAQMYWEAGRGVLREGAKDVAHRCFQKSRQMHKNALVGSSFYKTLTRLTSPLLAERFLQTLKNVRR